MMRGVLEDAALVVLLWRLQLSPIVPLEEEAEALAFSVESDIVIILFNENTRLMPNPTKTSNRNDERSKHSS